MNIFDGQLYADSGSGTFDNVFAVGTGLPTTTGSVAAPLSGMSGDPNGFALFDLDASIPGVDTVFVADTTLQRWTFDGTTWSRDSSFNALSLPCIGVAGWPNGSGVTLVATTTTNTVQRVDVPTTGSPTTTLLLTAAANTAYRGVSLAAN